jgi:adenylosuccinate synthase
MARHGVRVADLIDPAALRARLETEISAKNKMLTAIYDAEPIDSEKTIAELIEYGQRLKPHVTPAEMVVQDALDAGEEVVVECANGAMIDIDYGTYPYVTSSSPTAAGACQGAGIAPRQVERVIAVFKAYTSRVGGGPMPTELFDATGETIRERGREYGTTTGRPRRTGWFDAVAARYVARLNGVTEIQISLLDVLDVFEEINVCTSYSVGGAEIRHVPTRSDLISEVKPVYTQLKGWQQDITHSRTADDLPEYAHGYVTYLEAILGSPVTMAGVGPERSQLVPMNGDAAILKMAVTA